MKLITKTDVATEPVLAVDLRAWLAIDSTSQDTMLTGIAKAARGKVERLTGKAIAARTYTYTIEMPLFGVLELPYPPIVSITSVKYISSDATTATAAATDYSLVNNLLNYSGGIGYVVEVEYIAGVTATETEKQLILKQAAWDYMHRGDSESGIYAPDVLTEVQTYSIQTGW